MKLRQLFQIGSSIGMYYGSLIQFEFDFRLKMLGFSETIYRSRDDDDLSLEEVPSVINRHQDPAVQVSA